MVDSLCAQDVSVLGVINHETIAGIDYAPSEATYQTELANTASMLAWHYQGRITHWEVWNEPDLQKFGTPNEPDYVEPADFANLLNAVYSEIKAVNNQNKVISGGLFNSRPQHMLTLMQFIKQSTTPNSQNPHSIISACIPIQMVVTAMALIPLFT